MTVKNSSYPQIFYGQHFCPGVAEYRPPGQEPYRILIEDDVIREMMPTFEGKPVYVNHVEEVDVENLQHEADGYVTSSFFNTVDGKYWVKFVAVTERAKNAIRNGWGLSNAYLPKRTTSGGMWNGVDYKEKILNGEFEHLAIVRDPRYETKILTPEEFKEYNAEKELELKRLTNEKENKGEPAMLSLFKRTKVENAKEYEELSVVLPKSKVEMTLSQVINKMDDYELKMKEPQMANGDHHVEVGGKKMTVNELKEAHEKLHAEHNELKEAHEELKKNLGEDEADKDAHEKEKEGEGELVPNDEKEDVEAKKKAEELAAHEQKEIEEGKKNKKKNDKDGHFKNLKDAPIAQLRADMSRVAETSDDKVARGKARYGSGS